MAFHTELDTNNSNQTGLAGLTVYFDLMRKLGFYKEIRKRFSDYHPQQGWDAASIIIIAIILNLAGYDSVSDIDILLADNGFIKMFREYLRREMGHGEWRRWNRRFNSRSNQTLPSGTVIRDFLISCHDQEMVSQQGKATIHSASDRLKALNFILNLLVVVAYKKVGKPKRITIDQDATIINTFKAKALYSYLKCKAYQPVNLYCDELGCIIATEFREGNVPAKMHLMQMFQSALEHLPNGVKEIYYRGDSASCNFEFLAAMDSGILSSKYDIRFAVSALITARVKGLYHKVDDSEWTEYDDKQDYAEIIYTHEKLGSTRQLRLVLVRTKIESKDEKLPPKKHNPRQLELDLCFDNITDIKEDEVQTNNTTYKLRGIISNIPIEVYPPKNLITWARKRAGKSEEIHAIQKEDLSGGKLPSSKFGANWAWWIIVNIAYNLHAILNIIAFPKTLKNKRFKCIRAKLIACVGRVSTASRGFKLKIGNAIIFNFIDCISKRLEASF